MPTLFPSQYTILSCGALIPSIVSDSVLLCLAVDLVRYVQYSTDYILFGFFDAGNGRLDSIPFNIRAAVLHSDIFLQPRHQDLESNML